MKRRRNDYSMQQKNQILIALASGVNTTRLARRFKTTPGALHSALNIWRKRRETTVSAGKRRLRGEDEAEYSGRLRKMDAELARRQAEVGNGAVAVPAKRAARTKAYDCEVTFSVDGQLIKKVMVPVGSWGRLLARASEAADGER